MLDKEALVDLKACLLFSIVCCLEELIYCHSPKIKPPTNKILTIMIKAVIYLRLEKSFIVLPFYLINVIKNIGKVINWLIIIRKMSKISKNNLKEKVLNLIDKSGLKFKIVDKQL